MEKLILGKRQRVTCRVYPKIVCNYMLALIVFVLISSNAYGVMSDNENIKVYSPDKRLFVEVVFKDKVYYRVSYDSRIIVDASPVSMEIDTYNPGISPKVKSSKITELDEIITPVWGNRNQIPDHYNQLIIDFERDYSIEFRVFDYGVAYRFLTNFKEKKIVVKNEEATFRFSEGTYVWILDGASYESNFKNIPLGDEITSENYEKPLKVFLPALIEHPTGVKVLITEADLRDYPTMFLKRTNDYENYLASVFEKYALTTEVGGFSNYSMLAKTEADYIANTTGKRSYPWRVMIISDDDKVFADCDIVYQLASPGVLENTEWIKPGKVAWDWWHDYAVVGEEFIGGINTNTYLYQVDFAAEYHLDYIMVDWMWTDKYDLTLFNPDVDIKRIIQYAKTNGVGVILWCPGHTLHKQLNQALDLFAEIGASGIKVDFFGREDQTGIKMYEDIAIAAAHRKLIVDFHGCTKPTGLSRTYPNIINYEAVLGNEYNKIDEKNRCSIEHKVILPFTRGVIGPMDFTPGGMRNRIDQYARFYTLPQVQGTRSGEMALFVIYDEPLKMLCDAPHVYREESDLTQFISEIPTVWDNTSILDAKFGEYIIKLRENDQTIYVAGLNGKTVQEITLDLSFLKERQYAAVLLKDGLNANRIGTDYSLEKIKFETQSPLQIKMEKGGGFILKLELIQ